MKLSIPALVKVLKRRENGSGVVEVPIMPSAVIDLSRTASGTKGTVEITATELEEMVANFARFPGPVPIGVSPHVDYEDRAGFSPGFVNAVSVRDGVLYGELDLVAGLFAEVEAGGWRGFSVELAKDLKAATVELKGWVLVGGVFTNRPAMDVNFRIAASAADSSDQVATHSIRLDGGKETDMSQEKIAALEAEVSAQKELVTNLRTQAVNTSGEFKALEAKFTEVKKDLNAANVELSETKAKLGAAQDDADHLRSQLATEQQTRRETEIKLEAEQTRKLAEDVTKLAHKAIDRGVSAKHFEGLEEDPANWFRKRFVSLEAVEKFVDALPTVKESATSSGKRPDGTPTIPNEVANRLRRMGLNPKYAGVSDENVLLERGDSKE